MALFVISEERFSVVGPLINIGATIPVLSHFPMSHGNLPNDNKTFSTPVANRWDGPCG
jgi:hypothetical protein